MLCRNNVPSETILKIPKLNPPLFLELLGEEKDLCPVFQSEQVGELGYRDSGPDADARSDGYFGGFAIDQPANDGPTVKDTAIFDCICAYTGAQVLDIRRDREGRQPPYVFDLDSGFGAEGFAFVNDPFNYEFRWEC